MLATATCVNNALQKISLEAAFNYLVIYFAVHQAVFTSAANFYSKIICIYDKRSAKLKKDRY